jgi:hypothetical protein
LYIDSAQKSSVSRYVGILFQEILRRHVRSGQKLLLNPRRQFDPIKMSNFCHRCQVAVNRKNVR